MKTIFLSLLVFCSFSCATKCEKRCDCVVEQQFKKPTSAKGSAVDQGKGTPGGKALNSDVQTSALAKILQKSGKLNPEVQMSEFRNLEL